MDAANKFVAWFWVLCVLVVQEIAMGLSPCNFPAIYNFGDANSDTGGISAAFAPVSPPNGETFFGRPLGRVCDGRLVIDFMAEHLGLPYLSAYLDSIGTNFRHGANFATGGSTIRKLNVSLFHGGYSPFDLNVQLWQFDQFKARTSYLYNRGCFPSSRIYFQGGPGLLDPVGCIRSQNDIAVEFNKQLKERIIRLRAELSHAALTYVDIYTAKYKLITEAKSHGFVEPLKICCGRHHEDYHVWCGQKEIINGTEVYGASCGNPSMYISWDGVHYSHAANHWIANHILNGALSDPPIPVAESCHKHP